MDVVTKKLFFCQLAKYRETLKKNRVRAPLFENSGSATELSSFNDSLYSVNSTEILNLEINWTKFPSKTFLWTKQHTTPRFL